MKAFFLAICLSALYAWIGRIDLHAQVHPQVIVANGGVFGPGNTIRIGTWDLLTRQYTVFDSFPGRSVQHVLLHERTAFICADSVLVRYNLDTYQREAFQIVPGVRQSAVWHDNLIVSKGYGATGDYVEVRNKYDLSLDYGVIGVAGEAEGIVVVDDTAFVAVPIGFGASTGKIAVINLVSHLMEREIDLDTNGRIVKNIYRHGDKLYSVNQIDYFSSFGVISEYEVGTRTLTHHTVGLPTSQGTGIFQGKLFAAFGSGLGAWELQSATVTDTNICPGYWASMAMDTVHPHFYVTETDYATYGILHEYDWNGNHLDSIAIGISPEAIAVDNYVITQATNPSSSEVAIKAFPQPFGDHLSLDLRALPYPAERVEVLDLTGRVLLAESINQADLLDLETKSITMGFHVVKVYARGREWSCKVLKMKN